MVPGLSLNAVWPEACYKNVTVPYLFWIKEGGPVLADSVGLPRVLAQGW